jgi:hypothetical protein
MRAAAMLLADASPISHFRSAATRSSAISRRQGKSKGFRVGWTGNVISE